MEPDVARQRGNELGPTGRTVAENIRRCRLGVTLRELSQRLTDVGHSISTSSLQKIENGKRRVEVDDLLAIAFVLDVNPHALLAQQVDIHEGKPGELVATGVGEIGAQQFWDWLDGAEPIHSPDEDPRTFSGRTRPSWKRTVDHDAETRESLRNQLDDARLALETTRLALEEILKSRTGNGDD